MPERVQWDEAVHEIRPIGVVVEEAVVITGCGRRAPLYERRFTAFTGSPCEHRGCATLREDRQSARSEDQGDLDFEDRA
jgi:hypothetical protein